MSSKEIKQKRVPCVCETRDNGIPGFRNDGKTQCQGRQLRANGGRKYQSCSWPDFDATHAAAKAEKEAAKNQKEEEDLLFFLETNDQWPSQVQGDEGRLYRILRRAHKEGCATVELQTKIKNMQLRIQMQKEKKKKEKQEFKEETARITASVMSIPVNELPPFPSLANLCLNDTDDWLAASGVFDDMPSPLGTPPDWLSYGFQKLDEAKKK